MNKRVLCCVETTKKANTDYQYIRETLRHFYVESSKITIRPIYMESKSKYNSRAVKEQIRRESMNAKDTNVIYFVDTDDWDISIEDANFLEEIKTYCINNGYDFVYFCKDVEDVYLGKSVANTEKINAIRRFKSTRAIESITVSCLERNIYQVHCSNIMNMLDKYWDRKR